MTTKQNLPRHKSGELMSYIWPGGYPITYINGWNSILCLKCAIAMERNPDASQEDLPKSYFTHWEGLPIQCEDCCAEISSAYGDPLKKELYSQ